MKTRPWPLVLLAIFQILSPLGTILFNSWALGVKPTYVLQWVMHRTPLEIFESMFLMPIAGIAIYQMKNWSYLLFLGTLSWSLFANLRNWTYAESSLPRGMTLLVYVLQFGLAFYFMIPAVRRTYLDPRVRWWEAKRRFLLQVPVSLEIAGNPIEGVMQNISEGGIFLSCAHRLEPKQEGKLRFNVLNLDFEVQGQVVYVLEGADGKPSYGVRFLHTPESLKRFRGLARGLELIGLRDRDQEIRKPWYQSVMEWALEVLRTGKGLVPEIKSSRKS